ncbi:MAG: hotdog fold thioesterase [Bacteroidia bacterium]
MINTNIPLSDLREITRGTMVETLGMEFIELGPEMLKMRMPVDHRTRQPLGLLHGGASAALAETVGSMAAHLYIDDTEYYCVGIEIKCNHVRGITSGFVMGTATPIHTGKRTHVWQIDITDEEHIRVAFSTLTLAVLPKKNR